jgi:hypothetical protein
VSVKWKYGLLSHKKRVLLRKYQLIQPTYINNIGLYHAMYSRYMFMKCKWWMTYGQGRLISNIGSGQSSALRPLWKHGWSRFYFLLLHLTLTWVTQSIISLYMFMTDIVKTDGKWRYSDTVYGVSSFFIANVSLDLVL